MLLLLSYCSVFKVQTWKFLPRRSRKWSFLCLLSCSQESKWWAWEDSNLRPHAYQACALTTWATSPCQFRRPVVVSVFRRPVVEMRRIELLTPCLQGRCSPSWATPPNLVDTSLLTNIKSLVIFRMSRMSNLRLASYSPMCLLITATSLPIAPLRFTISHRHAHTMFRIATQC